MLNVIEACGVGLGVMAVVFALLIAGAYLFGRLLRCVPTDVLTQELTRRHRHEVSIVLYYDVDQVNRIAQVRGAFRGTRQQLVPMIEAFERKLMVFELEHAANGQPVTEGWLGDGGANHGTAAGVQ